MADRTRVQQRTGNNLGVGESRRGALPERRRRAPRCPHCGSWAVREILYGLLAEPTRFETHHFGGCVVRDKTWRCEDCRGRW